MNKEKQNIPQGYKDSVLGVIPEDWEVKRLGNLGEVVSGLTYSPDDIRDKGVLVLRSSNIQNRQLCFVDNVFVDVESFNPVIENDILICVRNGSRNLIGKNTLITKKIEGVAFGAFMSVFRSPNNSYLFQLFDSDYFYKKVNQNLGATINSINGNDLKDFRFPIPPLEEQRRIAEVLGCWDEAIEKQVRMVDLLTTRKRALMQRLLTPQPHWQKTKLSAILLEGSKKPVNDTSLYRKITIKLYKKGIEYSDNLKLMADTRPFYVRNKGELIIGKQNYFNGSIAIVHDEFDGTICSNAIMSFRVNSDFNKLFVYETISQTRYLKKREMMANGTGQKELSEKDFLKFDIEIPPLAEQKAIAEKLSTADAEIDLARRRLDLLRTQKRALMQQLLTGKKRLKIDKN